MGGGTKEQCGSNKAFLVPPFRLPENLTIGLIWLVTRGGGVGGVGQGGGQIRLLVFKEPRRWNQ